MDTTLGYLTLGPILFHWPAETKRDFYFKIADESPINTVYLGEVVCSKRSPFLMPYYAEITDRLARAGKKVIFSSLAEVMTQRERKITGELCHDETHEVEANDTSAIYHLRKKPHRIGQYCNVYNEETLRFLALNGAYHVVLPAELPRNTIGVMSETAKTIGVSLEVQVSGRVGLALSARCYHARSYGRVKDNCQYVCEHDPDGMPLKTLTDQSFLCINGIQTMSYGYLNLLPQIPELMEMGITNFRISPHSLHTDTIIEAAHSILQGSISGEQATSIVQSLLGDVPCFNGFYNHAAGYEWSSHDHSLSR